MKWAVRLFLISLSTTAFSQTDIGLKGYFNFDDCTANESRGDASIISVVSGMPTCECGPSGKAFRFDGLDDHILIAGTVNGEFNSEDFSISFYFKSNGLVGTQTILKKSDTDCPTQNVFAIRYDAGTRLLNVQMVENTLKNGSVTRIAIARESCWNHIAVARKSNKTSVYLNGRLVAESTASSRVNLQNTGVLTIGESVCSNTDRNFDGLIDELRVYNRALKEEEIEELSTEIDKILTDDTRIFLSESVNITTTTTCATQFSWSPATGVSDPKIANPVITPTETTTYRLSFGNTGCIASDTIRIVVIDPSTLNCDKVFLPNAFTPNGDNLNESYGISNPEIFTFGNGEMESFEIFDRWGNLVFVTTDPNEKWDGAYKGELINPGVLLYKVRYSCEGEEKIEAGSLTILR